MWWYGGNDVLGWCGGMARAGQCGGMGGHDVYGTCRHEEQGREVRMRHRGGGRSGWPTCVIGKEAQPRYKGCEGERKLERKLKDGPRRAPIR